MAKNKMEYENFDRTVRELLKVSRAAIKAKLEEEKRDKAQRKKSKKG